MDDRGGKEPQVADRPGDVQAGGQSEGLSGVQAFGAREEVEVSFDAVRDIQEQSQRAALFRAEVREADAKN